jgi:hypothetical protein
MGGSPPRIYWSRWTMRSIFLKVGLTDLQLASWCLTTLPVTKSVRQMHYQHAKCPKTLIRLGDIKKVMQECETLPMELIKQESRDKTFITTMITLQCLDGSREWRKLFEKGDYGRKKDLMPSVKASNARRTRLLAAVGASFSRNLILFLRNHTSRNLLHHVVIFATSIQNTIVS